jgi:hypothetical protein
MLKRYDNIAARALFGGPAVFAVLFGDIDKRTWRSHVT